MHKIIILLITFYWFIGCGQDKSTQKSIGKKINTDQTKEEDFDNFLKKFSINKDFQISRVKFPVNNKVYNTDNQKFDSLLITKKEWVFSNLNNKKYIKKITKENTNKFILNIQIDESGIDVNYIFELINGEWFLVTIIDQST